MDYTLQKVHLPIILVYYTQLKLAQYKVIVIFQILWNDAGFSILGNFLFLLLTFL